MTVRPPSLTLPHIMGEGEGGGPRLVVRGKSRARGLAPPSAAVPVPLIRHSRVSALATEAS